MTLDPYTDTFLKRLNAIHFSLTRNMTPQQARKRERALVQLITVHEPEYVAHVEDRTIPGLTGEIPLRIYAPHTCGLFPIFIYFHSGGGVIGDLDSEDALCRRLTNLAGCLVISINYHLAPEYKFPFGLEECYAAIQWLAIHAADFNGSASQLAIGGMSAGATIAAVIAQMARDREGVNFIFQVLLAPITDLRLPNTCSMETYAEGYLLTREDISWFIHQYLDNDDDRTHPLASPFLAPTLAGLPPAIIITAECDPLRDDGERYGNRLREAGVTTVISRRKGAIHGFLVAEQLDPVLIEAAAALYGAFTK